MNSFIRIIILTISLALFSLLIKAQDIVEHKAPDREFLKSIVVNKFAVPENKSAFTIVQELNNLLGDTDPELRDRLAYSIISVWVGDEAKLSNEQLLLLFDVWRANLRKGVGEIDTDSVLRRSFSTLCLASLAERDLTKPFLGDKRFHELLGDAVLSLKDERDLRGYDLQKGWIHATAHTADLLKFLARNPLLNDNDQKALLDAISNRLLSAPTVYIQGEQGRLARAVAAVIIRKDFNLASFNQWLTELKQNEKSAFEKKSPMTEKLTIYQNNTYMLQALIAYISMNNDLSKQAIEAKDVILKMLTNR